MRVFFKSITNVFYCQKKLPKKGFLLSKDILLTPNLNSDHQRENCHMSEVYTTQR